MLIPSIHKSVDRERARGAGIVNSLINNLPFELHIPGYNYCGPGTKLDKRLSRGDTGINELDEACKQHDIAYANNPSSLEIRHKADLELAAAAEKRFRDSNARFGERLAGLAINKIMKHKVKRGMGVTFARLVRESRQAIRKKHQLNGKNGKVLNMNRILKSAMKAARKTAKGRIVIKTPRVIPLPKTGGFLPLIPLLTALAATGTLAGGVTTAAKNIYDMVTKKKQGESKIGKGLYLRPYKQGMGLYLSPYTPKN